MRGAAAKGFDVDLAGLSAVLVGEGSLSGSVSEAPDVGTSSSVVGKSSAVDDLWPHDDLARYYNASMGDVID